MEDIRWKQRFENYCRAFATLRKAIVLARERELSDLEKQGVIQGFEFTHELSWKVLKDFLQFQGDPEVYGSRDAVRKANEMNLLSHGSVWMEMIKSRNLTSHTYNQIVSEQLFQKITEVYFPAFEALEQRFFKLLEQDV